MIKNKMVSKEDICHILSTIEDIFEYLDGKYTSRIVWDELCNRYPKYKIVYNPSIQLWEVMKSCIVNEDGKWDDNTSQYENMNIDYVWDICTDIQPDNSNIFTPDLIRKSIYLMRKSHSLKKKCEDSVKIMNDPNKGGITRKCLACGEYFYTSEKKINWMLKEKRWNLPKRCKNCKNKDRSRNTTEPIQETSFGYNPRIIGYTHSMTVVDNVTGKIETLVQKDKSRWEPIEKYFEFHIPDNKYGILYGYYSLDEIINLIKMFRNNPEIIEFITNMMKK